jgi:hypothetical protein
MVKIDLRVHKVPGANTALLLPDTALARQFSVFGVSLSFGKGEALSERPSRWDEFVAILNKWHPTPLTPGSPAHLFIAGEWDDEGAGGTNGILLTPERSAIAVFTSSDELKSGSQDLFLQVIGHELCHLLNLTHEHGDESLPSAECPESKRRGRKPALAWIGRGRIQPTGVQAYPLSGASERLLASATPSHILPWGERFYPVGTEAMDGLSARIDKRRIR